MHSFGRYVHPMDRGRSRREAEVTAALAAIKDASISQAEFDCLMGKIGVEINGWLKKVLP